MNKLKSLPILLNIHKRYKGLCYSPASLELALDNEDLLLFPGQMIFPAVADRYQVNLCCIERNIVQSLNTAGSRIPARRCSPWLPTRSPESHRMRISGYSVLVSAQGLNTETCPPGSLPAGINFPALPAIPAGTHRRPTPGYLPGVGLPFQTLLSSSSDFSSITLRISTRITDSGSSSSSAICSTVFPSFRAY